MSSSHINMIETFHTPPNDEVLMVKLSLGHVWFTAEIFLQLTCSSKINYSFMYLNLWKFELSYEIAWNFPQMTDWIFAIEKT